VESSAPGLLWEPGHESFHSTGTQGVGETGKEYINAFDLRTLDFAWRDLEFGISKGWGGVMSTATGLVAHGDDAENFVILNGYTGKPLWHFNVGQLIRALPWVTPWMESSTSLLRREAMFFPSRCLSVLTYKVENRVTNELIDDKVVRDADLVRTVMIDKPSKRLDTTTLRLAGWFWPRHSTSSLGHKSDYGLPVRRPHGAQALR
jgi:hypothetical protein